MKLKIEKPDFADMLKINLQGLMPGRYTISIINKWFQEHVEPVNKMLADGVAIYQHPNHIGWDSRYCINECYHKALLINIQPIKK